MGNGNNQYNFKELDNETIKNIQAMYDNGAGINSIAKFHNISISKIYSLKNKKLIFLNRTKEESKALGLKNKIKRFHTEESRRLISEKRKKWIAENPDKSPYLLSHKSRGETYPEKYFREWLEKENIPFQQEYRFKLYAFDFLVNERIDLEIDGDQHKNDKRIIKHDINRDNKSKDAGFIVYRIMWSDYQKLTQAERSKFLLKLKSFLLDDSNPIPEFVIKKHIRPRKEKARKVTSKFFVKHKVDECLYPYDYRELMALEMFKNGNTFDKIGEVFGISRMTASRWVDLACEDESTRKKISINKKRHGANKTKNNISSEDIKQEALKMLKTGMSYLEVAKKFDVSDNSIRKWVCSLGKNPKDYGHNKNNRKNNSGLKTKLLNNKSELMYY